MAASILEVLITGDATGLTAAYGQATAATKAYQAETATASSATARASATATQFGQAASKAWTYAKLGALAFAAISVKTAVDFNREFTLIAAVTNTTADRIDSLKQTVIGLSSATGVGPVELAHSMYFLASAGLTVTQQMQALDAVAHGAAVGLGDAGDLARITANSLNAFADQGLTATQVMDTLTAAIREGTAEPNEFATALGRVLPIADHAGISFQAVAASLASMSNAGLDVQEGVTALRAILQSLVAPTAQTESAFATMGLTVTDVVASMQGKGLIATLRTVSDAAHKATDSQGAYNQLMRHAIPNIRGLAGAMNLLGQDTQHIDQIFQAVLNSAGDLAKAFATTEQSSAFKLKKALNDLQIVGMNLATIALPVLAKGLTLVADHAEAVLKVLLAYAGMRFIAPMLRDMAAANLQLAESQAAAAAAPAAAAVAPTVVVAGRVIPAVATAAPAATTAVTGLASAMGGLIGVFALFGNMLGESGLPQIYAIIDALGNMKAEIIGFMHTDLSAVVGSIFSALKSPALTFATGGGLLGTFLDQIKGPSADQMQKITDAIDVVNVGLTAAGIDAQKKVEIINTALASVGGNVTPANADAFVGSVQAQIDVLSQQKAAADEAAKAALDLAKQQQAANESTKSWQVATAQMTDKLTGLSAIGIDVNSFMAQLQTDLAGSDDQAKTFADAIDQVTKAWYDFQAAAVKSLTFAPQALSDLTSAAQGAQDQLDGMTSSSTTSASELATLRDTANLTGQDILKTFQDARAQTIAFGKDLLEVSRVGGQAGKDLAASLMESGNVMAAQIIADSPGKLQRQIVEASGASANAADKWGTKLTDAIAGPLDDIVKILKKLAFQAFGISVDLNDHGAKKQVDDLTHSIKDLPVSTVIGIKTHDNTAQQQVDHLASSIKALPASTVLDIKAHIHAGSPWPDEALKMHLYDPIKRMGFKQIAGRWTLPLDVAVHSDGIMPHRITNVGAPSTPNYTAAIDAFTSGAGGQVSSILSKLYPNNGDAKTANLLEKISHEARQTGKLNLSALKDLLREQKSAKWVSAWADQAQRAFAAGLKAEKGPPKWYDLATKNVPKLPEGTHGHKDRHVDVRITRPHMDDAMSYQTDYSGF